MALTDGLVGFWPLDGNPNDASGNDLNGVFTGGVIAGVNHLSVPNKASLFDGLDGAMSVANDPSMNNTSMTVAAWVMVHTNPDCDANNNYRSLIRQGALSNTVTGWDVVLEQNRSTQFDVVIVISE